MRMWCAYCSLIPLKDRLPLGNLVWNLVLLICGNSLRDFFSISLEMTVPRGSFHRLILFEDKTERRSQIF